MADLFSEQGVAVCHEVGIILFWLGFFVSNCLLEFETALAQVRYTPLWWCCMYTYMVDCYVSFS
jgi:hypothetical protein